MLQQARVLQQLLMRPKDVALRRVGCVIAQPLQLIGRPGQRVLQRGVFALRLAGIFVHLQRAVRHLHHVTERRTGGGAHAAQHIRHPVMGDGVGIWGQHHVLNLFATALAQQLGQLAQGRLGIRPRRTEVNAVCIRGLQRHDRHQRLGIGAVVLAMQLNTCRKAFRRLGQHPGRSRMQAIGVGQQHGLRTQHRTVFMTGCPIAFTRVHLHVQKRLPGLDVRLAVRQRLKTLPADHQHQRQQTAGMQRQVVGIELNQRLPGLNPLAFLNLRDKTFALKVHRVQPNVQQHLHTAVVGDAQGMPRVLQVADHPGQRGA